MRVATSPDEEMRELFDDLDLGAKYRTELIDGRISVRGMPSLQHCLILTWLVYQLRHLGEPRDWTGLSAGGLVLLPSGDRVRPDLSVVRRADVPSAGIPAEDVMLAAEIITADAHRDSAEAVRKGCSRAGIPFYLLIDILAGPPTATLYSAPLFDGYRSITQVPAGDELYLPDPFNTRLDTTALLDTTTLPLP